ncbi:prolipoprotein diacylglyceryl transferase [bacterium]|nr:prolipoprotein diacylglyceryl transferase [bacterium]
MYPVLLKLGRFEIHAYGLMLAISFLVGIYWAMRRSDRKGIDRNDIMDLSLLVVISAILGSRLLYVVTHLEEFQGRWLDTINPFQSTGEIGIAGLSMLGGVVLSVIVIAVYCFVKKISILKLGDIFTPSFAAGIFLTRIGCFLNGCCFGKTCSLPWAVRFPLNSPAGYVQQGAPLHPTQLYASLYGLGIALILYFFDRKQRFDGAVLALFLMLYGTARFLIDFVRYYEASVMFPFFGVSLTVNQAISFLMVVTGLLLYLVLGRTSLKKA